MANYRNVTRHPLSLESGAWLPAGQLVDLASIGGTDSIHVAQSRLVAVGGSAPSSPPPMTLVRTDGVDLYSTNNLETPLVVEGTPGPQGDPGTSGAGVAITAGATAPVALTPGTIYVEDLGGGASRLHLAPGGGITVAAAAPSVVAVNEVVVQVDGSGTPVALHLGV